MSGHAIMLDPPAWFGPGEPLLARRGDLLLAHFLLGHNIGGNTSADTRRILYYRLAAEGHAERSADTFLDPFTEYPSCARRPDQALVPRRRGHGIVLDGVEIPHDVGRAVEVKEAASSSRSRGPRRCGPALGAARRERSSGADRFDLGGYTLKQYSASACVIGSSDRHDSSSRTTDRT